MEKKFKVLNQIQIEEIITKIFSEDKDMAELVKQKFSKEIDNDSRVERLGNVINRNLSQILTYGGALTLVGSGYEKEK